MKRGVEGGRGERKGQGETGSKEGVHRIETGEGEAKSLAFMKHFRLVPETARYMVLWLSGCENVASSEHQNSVGPSSKVCRRVTEK